MEIDANVAEAGSLRSLFHLRDVMRGVDRMCTATRKVPVRVFGSPDYREGRPR